MLNDIFNNEYTLVFSKQYGFKILKTTILNTEILFNTIYTIVLSKKRGFNIYIKKMVLHEINKSETYHNGYEP